MIIPTVFSTTKEGFESRLELAESFTDYTHLDYMDGSFVSSTSIRPHETPTVTIPHDIHLMYEEPKTVIEESIRLHPNRIIIHVEAKAEPALHRLEKTRIEPVLAKNPGTDRKDLLPFLTRHETIMLMGHTPGSENAGVYEGIEDDISFFVHHGATVMIDGGVSKKSIQSLREAGATIFNVGSAIFNSTNPKEAYNTL